jgi:hypothetical protein
MNTESSIYIPRMSTRWTEDGIRNIIKKNRIGMVSRVDFTSINKKPGFGKDIGQIVMSAFVYFYDPKKTCSFEPITKFWSTIESDSAFNIQISDNEYWICLKNKRPIKYLHQVDENCRQLEKLVTVQNEEIKQLKMTVDSLSKTVEQLLGGLYCQRTQEGCLTAFKAIGIKELSPAKSKDNTNPSGILSRTRQGDAHEKRIAKLEHFIEHHISSDVILGDCDECGCCDCYSHCYDCVN